MISLAKCGKGMDNASNGSGSRPASARMAGGQIVSLSYNFRPGAPARHGAPLTDNYCGGGAHVIPASSSMFESSLYKQREFELPQQSAGATVKSSLESDMVNWRSKYSTSTMEEKPSFNSARYTYTSPELPNHTKYSRPATPDDEELRNPFPLGVAFSVKTLEEWFYTIDRDKSGSISQRELIVGLHHHKQLLALFRRLSELQHAKDVQAQEESEAERMLALGVKPTSERGSLEHKRNTLKSMSRAGSVMLRKSTLTQFHFSEEAMLPDDLEEGSATKITRAQHRLEEIVCIKALLQEVDKDNSGSVTFNEFLEFFRRSGLLLEYAAYPGLNEPLGIGPLDDNPLPEIQEDKASPLEAPQPEAEAQHE